MHRKEVRIKHKVTLPGLVESRAELSNLNKEILGDQLATPHKKESEVDTESKRKNKV